MGNVAVVGIGNLSRGDDAIGILAARRIRAELPDVRVIESSGDITELLECFREFEAIYIIDALYSKRAKPGSIHEFDAVSGALPDTDLLTSSHALGLSQAIELARVLGALPSQLHVMGVQGGDFQIGEGISKTAQLGVNQVVKLVINKIKRGAVHA